MGAWQSHATYRKCVFLIEILHFYIFVFKTPYNIIPYKTGFLPTSTIHRSTWRQKSKSFNKLKLSLFNFDHRHVCPIIYITTKLFTIHTIIYMYIYKSIYSFSIMYHSYIARNSVQYIENNWKWEPWCTM